MPPPPGECDDRRLRSATTRALSSRRGRPPRRRPRSRPGCGRPRPRAAARRTSTVRRARPSRPRAPAAPRPRGPARAPRLVTQHISSDQSVCGASAAAQRSNLLRIRARCVEEFRPPCPHCEPWPGKTNTVLPSTSAEPAPRAVRKHPESTRIKADQHSRGQRPPHGALANAARVVVSENATSESVIVVFQRGRQTPGGLSAQGACRTCPTRPTAARSVRSARRWAPALWRDPPAAAAR
jgi:hypothetical protein